MFVEQSHAVLSVHNSGREAETGDQARRVAAARHKHAILRVGMEYWIIQCFNGISFGALLFLLASGLSLIFGVMNIVNVSHGSYFMLGGYIGYTVVNHGSRTAYAVDR